MVASAVVAAAWDAGVEVADPPQETAITSNKAASIGTMNPKLNQGRLDMKYISKYWVVFCPGLE
jgi:hypothetical protein